MIKLIAQDDKNMANGMRDMSRTPLTNAEIVYVKSEIQKIGAEEKVFVFNDEEHIHLSTCYNFIEDRIYVTRNVFPDTKYGSIHPRDLMSVRAVLAHEYYGHRTYRGEYIADYLKGPNFYTTEIWKDECRASIGTITYVGEESQERNQVDRNNRSSLSKMWRETREFCDFER